MNVTTKGIYGLLVDDQGRCQHYHSELDIIANRCGICGRLYACYKCHDELEDHIFGPVPADQKDSVMCGVCGQLYTYAEYSTICSCSHCGSSFNPKCSLHKEMYSI